MASRGKSTCLFLETLTIIGILLIVFVVKIDCKKKKDVKPDEAWKKKDITDYSDADLERLYEQWEVRLIFARRRWLVIDLWPRGPSTSVGVFVPAGQLLLQDFYIVLSLQ